MAAVTSAFSKSSVFARQFSPSTLTYLAGVFKFIHFGERFQKVPFSATENAVLVWTEGLYGEKSCVALVMIVHRLEKDGVI